MKNRLILFLLTVLLLFSMVCCSPINAKYVSVITGGIAYTVDIPVRTQGQEDAITNLKNVMNDPEAMEILQGIISDNDSGWFSAKNYVLSSDVLSDYASNASGKSDEAVRLIELLAQTDKAEADRTTYVIKFDPSETDGARTKITIFSTPEPANNSSGTMVPNVLKTIFYETTDSNGNKYYDCEDPINGTALRSGSSYNTDYWAAYLALNAAYSVDLNLVTDGDVSTNYGDQDAAGVNNSLINAYTYVCFTPEESGTYTINVSDECRISNTTSLNSTRGYTEIPQSSITVDSSGSCHTSVTLTAGTTYYYAFRMPSDADTAVAYPVSITITRG